jgi:inosine triphosphate pyrophosphatase
LSRKVDECKPLVLGPPRGDVHHGKASWNSVFTPAGYVKTFGELDFHEQAEFSHRRRAIDMFLEAAKFN